MRRLIVTALLLMLVSNSVARIISTLNVPQEATTSPGSKCVPTSHVSPKTPPPPPTPSVHPPVPPARQPVLKPTPPPTTPAPPHHSPSTPKPPSRQLSPPKPPKAPAPPKPPKTPASPKPPKVPVPPTPPKGSGPPKATPTQPVADPSSWSPECWDVVSHIGECVEDMLHYLLNGGEVSNVCDSVFRDINEYCSMQK